MYFEYYANLFQNNLNENKTSFWVVSTQIDIVIQRYLRNLRKKSAVKHVHIERNITLNIETFQLALITVLSNKEYQRYQIGQTQHF